MLMIKIDLIDTPYTCSRNELQAPLTSITKRHCTMNLNQERSTVEIQNGLSALEKTPLGITHADQNKLNLTLAYSTLLLGQKDFDRAHLGLVDKENGLDIDQLQLAIPPPSPCTNLSAQQLPAAHSKKNKAQIRDDMMQEKVISFLISTYEVSEWSFSSIIKHLKSHPSLLKDFITDTYVLSILSEDEQLDLKALLIADTQLLKLFIDNAQLQSLSQSLNWGALSIYFTKTNQLKDKIAYLESIVIHQLEQHKVQTYELVDLFFYYYPSCRKIILSDPFYTKMLSNRHTDSQDFIAHNKQKSHIKPVSDSYPDGSDMYNLMYLNLFDHFLKKTKPAQTAYDKLRDYTGFNTIDLVATINTSLSVADFRLSITNKFNAKSFYHRIKVRQYLFDNKHLAKIAIVNPTIREALDTSTCFSLANNDATLLTLLLDDPRVNSNEWLKAIFSSCLKNKTFSRTLLKKKYFLHRFSGDQLFDISSINPSLLTIIMHDKKSRIKLLGTLALKMALDCHHIPSIYSQFCMNSLNKPIDRIVTDLLRHKQSYISTYQRKHLLAHLYALNYSDSYAPFRPFLTTHVKAIARSNHEEQEVERLIIERVVRHNLSVFLDDSSIINGDSHGDIVDKIISDETTLLFQFINSLENDPNAIDRLLQICKNSTLMNSIIDSYQHHKNINDTKLCMFIMIGHLSVMAGYPDIAKQYFENALETNKHGLSSRDLLSLGDLYLILPNDEIRKTESINSHVKRLESACQHYELAERKGNKNATHLLTAIRKDLAEKFSKGKNKAFFCALAEKNYALFFPDDQPLLTMVMQHQHAPKSYHFSHKLLSILSTNINKGLNKPEESKAYFQNREMVSFSMMLDLLDLAKVNFGKHHNQNSHYIISSNLTSTNLVSLIDPVIFCQALVHHKKAGVNHQIINEIIMDFSPSAFKYNTDESIFIHNVIFSKDFTEIIETDVMQYQFINKLKDHIKLKLINCKELSLQPEQIKINFDNIDHQKNFSYIFHYMQNVPTALLHTKDTNLDILVNESIQNPEQPSIFLLEKTRRLLTKKSTINDTITRLLQIKYCRLYNSDNLKVNHDQAGLLLKVIDHLIMLGEKSIALKHKNHNTQNAALTAENLVIAVSKLLSDNLYLILQQQNENQKINSPEYIALKKQIEILIAQSKPELNKHRDTKYILANIAIAFAALITGIGLIPWGIALAVNRGFFFRKPKSAQLLEELTIHSKKL